MHHINAAVPGANHSPLLKNDGIYLGYIMANIGPSSGVHEEGAPSTDVAEFSILLTSPEYLRQYGVDALCSFLSPKKF